MQRKVSHTGFVMEFKLYRQLFEPHEQYIQNKHSPKFMVEKYQIEFMSINHLAKYLQVLHRVLTAFDVSERQRQNQFVPVACVESAARTRSGRGVIFSTASHFIAKT